METRTCIHPFFLPSPHCTTPAVSHHLSSSAIAGLSLRHQLRFFLASAFFWKHLDLLHHTYILSLSDLKKRTRRRLFCDCCGFLKSKGASEAPLKPSVPFPCSLLDAIERRLWFCSFKAHDYCSIPFLSQEEASLAYFLMNRLVSGGPRTKWRFGFWCEAIAYYGPDFQTLFSLGAISPLKSHIEPRWFRLWSFLTAALALKKIFFSHRSIFAALNSLAFRYIALQSWISCARLLRGCVLEFCEVFVIVIV